MFWSIIWSAFFLVLISLHLCILLKDVILRQKDGINEVNEEINYSYEGSNEKCKGA